MSQQYDFQPGFDLSSLASATQSQVMQALGQMSPLSNIGGIYYSTTAPDVINNPRFTRYIWIDITDVTNPVLKRYIVVAGVGSWAAAGIANSGIVAGMLATYAVTLLQGDNTTSKIALRPDQAADLARANFVLRVDPTGTFVEAVSMDTFLNNSGAIGLNHISLVGSADNYILSVIGGVLAYRALSSITIPANSIPVASIANGTTGNVLAYVGGILTSVVLDPSIYLSASGAAANDILAFNGTNWVKKTPPWVNKHTSADTAMTAANSQILGATAHNLGVVPSSIKILLVNKANNGGFGYAVNDVVPLECFASTTSSGVVGLNLICVAADASNYRINQSLGTAGGLIFTCPKAGGAPSSESIANFVLDWNVRIVLMA